MMLAAVLLGDWPESLLLAVADGNQVGRLKLIVSLGMHPSDAESERQLADLVTRDSMIGVSTARTP